MESSISAIRNALVPHPQQRPAPGQDRSAQFIDKVRRQARQLKVKSYLDLVPAEYRETVKKMAEDAFPTKGAGRTMEEFTEVMALKWLAQKEAFEVLSRESGFRQVNRASASRAEGILALTSRGSLVAIAQPEGAFGERGIMYGRIDEREDTTIKPFNSGFLLRQVTIGDRLRTSAFKSSPVIALVAKEGAEREEVKGSFIDMTMTLNTIGRTVFVPRKVV